MWNPLSPSHGRFSRRDVLGSAVVAGASALARSALPAGQSEPGRKGEGKAVRGRIKQSIAFWCFNSAGEKWDLARTCQVAKELSCPSVELVAPKDWPVLKKHGLVCAMSPNGMPAPPFVRGWNNPKYHEELIARTTEAIEACAAAGFPNVIAFTGYKWRDAEDPKSGEIGRDEGAKNAIAGLKKIVGHAEKKGVTICLEHLNTRDDSHPMKGHPGYQGDDLDWVVGIIRAVGSPRLRLLFDVYHVQVMHGDVIRRIEQQKDLIGHVHVAGNPGRGELDDRQEINYPPIMWKLLDIGYSGYVGQEFIPTREPLAGLREAVRLCDV
ncbi:MAG: TIM barrel protein [Planctomycetia bacterium]|nr:TIM barrel protein [Planctomycetia bacterium]